MSAAELAATLQTDGVLRTPSLIAAFRAIDRADFVPPALRSRAYVNAPLPIGFGQTISQPWTVAFMLEQLQPRAGQTVLDIGAGSGWQTALLSAIVSAKPTGRVFALERIAELAEQARQNLSRYNFIASSVVELHAGSAEAGFPAAAPFDGIIAAAMLSAVPPAWLAQLAVGGHLVAPVSGAVVCLEKTSDTTFARQEYPGFAFVPFITSPKNTTAG